VSAARPPDLARRLRLAVVGASGRMGQAVLELAARQADVEVVAAIDAPGSASVGRQIGGAAVTDDLIGGLAGVDVYVDFSAPAASRAAAQAAVAGTAAVIGTTGLGVDDQAALDGLATRAPVLWSANFSLGVNLMLALVETAARTLPGWDAEIVELHHKLKRDAPSGTALALGEAIAAGHAVRLADVARTVRSGQVGQRPAGEIGLAAVRGGDVIGEHTVYLFGDGERIELGHKATSREIFAAGALRAARFLAGKPAGRYAMRDVLGL
jgi:4-hydroxy-tetrahydrodipicolinate reductase